MAVSSQFALPSTTSCNLTLPVQHETCEQSSGNWNSCWLPLGTCLRTPSFPTHALGLCYFHNMTSQSVVCQHVSQNYCQGLKTESVPSTKTAAMSQRGLLHSIILIWLPLQVTSSVRLMELSCPHFVAALCCRRNVYSELQLFCSAGEELWVIGGWGWGFARLSTSNHL